MNQSSRTEQWLRQATCGERESEIIQLLGREHVAIVLGADVCAEPQAQFLFSFAVNLTARLFPIVHRLSIIIPKEASLVAPIPRWREPLLTTYIHTFLSALAPPIAWDISTALPKTATLTLAVGRHAPVAPKPTVYVGSRGWNTYFSPSTPEDADGVPNPVGAYAAACIGVVEIWKRLLAPYRERLPGFPIIPRDQRLVFSALTYRQTDDEDPPLTQGIDIGRLTLVGAGAGGGAAAFVLASIPSLIGYINAIDPDAVEPTNLNRYVSADAADARAARFKVSLVRELFGAHGRVAVNPLPEAFGTAAGKLSTPDFRHVLAAVHSRGARREIQRETPMVLWDCGAAEHGEFRVWRMILGQSECMYCKHPQNDADPELAKARQLQLLLGLEAGVWVRKMKDHEPFKREEVVAIAAHLSAKAVLFALPKESERFNDWEAAQCGKISLPKVDDAIPIPFAPVMAGVLVAGEVIKEQIAPHHVLDASYENTLMGSFSPYRRPERRFPRADCAFCHDAVNVKQYQRRWEAA